MIVEIVVIIPFVTISARSVVNSRKLKVIDMKQSIGALKYWLRLHRIPLSKFGTGMKNNPIKVKSKKKVV